MSSERTAYIRRLAVALVQGTPVCKSVPQAEIDEAVQYALGLGLLPASPLQVE